VTNLRAWPGARWSAWRFAPWVALALFSALLVPIYRTDPRRSGALETHTAGFTAHSLAREGDFGIEEYYPQATPGGSTSYAVRWRGSHLVGIEPAASSLTFAVLMLPYRGLPPSDADRIFALFPVVAARVAALAVFVLGLLLLSIASPARALGVAAAIALATSQRTIAGAALWQHTSASLWLALGLWLWVAAERRPRLHVVAGIALALATACRPILVPAPLALLGQLWWQARCPRKIALVTTIATAAIGVAALAANVALHGSLLGGRVEILAAPGLHSSTAAYFSFSPVHLAGFLFAPSRGLFVYSPVLLFGLGGLWRCWRDVRHASLRWISYAGLVVFALYGWIATWWGGVAFGSRYGTDLLMFFALWLALAPVPRRARALWIGALSVALCWSLAVQEIGARAYPCGWDQKPVHVDVAPERVWSWRDTQIERCARRLWRQMRGAGLRASADCSDGVYQIGEVHARS
jgi:hypothetical protein